MDLKYFANVLILETFRSGATGVVANDIDPNCRLALDMNAELSKQSLAGVEMVEADLLAGDNDTRMEVLRSTDVVLVGDMFYDEHIGGEVYNLCSTFKSLKKENEVSVFVLRSKDNDSPPLPRCMWVTQVGGRSRNIRGSIKALPVAPSII